ncbi:MAG: M23 family metallopeptidase, partial [Vicinamibacterales bacterium]
IAIPLWTWGPPLVFVSAAVLLAGSLVSAWRGFGWTWKRTAAFAILAGLVITLPVYRTFPSAYDDTPSDVLMDLPLEGPVTVAWGGRSPGRNYHVGSPAERWAFDLLITVDGVSHRNAGKVVTDYYAYDTPVHAPADGLVVSVRDGVPDAVPGEAEPDQVGGNTIVMEVAPNQYLFLVHLKAGSLRVAPGERVKRGDIVAHVGNSGNTSEPHLHIHLQDAPSLERAQGIPFYFSNYVDVRANTYVQRGIPRGGIRRGQYRGDIVRAAH